MLETDSLVDINIIEKNGKYYFGKISSTGYDEIEEDGFIPGRPRVKLNGKYGIVNAADGSWVISAICDSIDLVFTEEYLKEDGICRSSYIVSINGKFGSFDEEGHPLVPCKYDGLGPFCDGDRVYDLGAFYQVELDGKNGIANRAGKVVWEV